MNSEDAVLVIFFVVVTVIGAIFMGAGDAEGARTPIWAPVEYMIDESPTGGMMADGAARGPNNIVYRAWQDDDYSIKVSYTDNNGSSWSVSTVINSAWRGHTYVALGGIAVLANNTTMVHFITEDADDNYNSYVACRWNWEGSWDIIEIYGHATTGMSRPKMTVNETCVLLTYYNNLEVRYKHFWPSNSDVIPLPNILPEDWLPAAEGNIEDYDVTVNQSGYFIITGKTWSGSNYRYYTRDLNGTHAVVYATEPTGLVKPYGVQLVCTSEDTFAIGCTWDRLGTSLILHFYETTQWGGFISRYINAQTMDIDSQSLGSCIDDDDRLTYYWANDTDEGGGTYISKTTALINATEETWEGNIVDAVYDYGTDDDEWWEFGWYNGKYPVVGGYSVNIPNAGWMGQHIWKDEVGSPDDYAFALYWEASFHWYDWGPPDGPGPDDDDDYDDTTTTVSPIDMTLMGELWVLLAGTAMFVSLARIYKMHIYRKRW